MQPHLLNKILRKKLNLFVKNEKNFRYIQFFERELMSLNWPLTDFLGENFNSFSHYFNRFLFFK